EVPDLSRRRLVPVHADRRQPPPPPQQAIGIAANAAVPVAAGHEIPQEPPDRLYRVAVRTTTSHGTTPSASATRPHRGKRTEAMSRSTNPPDSPTRLPSKESREFYRPAHGQRIHHPRRVAR